MKTQNKKSWLSPGFIFLGVFFISLSLYVIFNYMTTSTPGVTEGIVIK